MKKIIFIYAYPHTLHKAWADTITKKHYKFIPSWIPKSFMMNAILSQVSALLKTPFIPSADLYLAEDLVCILPAILRKKKNGKIIVINSSPSFLRALKSKGILKKIFNWYISKVDFVISTSEMMQKIAFQTTKVKNTIIYPPLLNEKFININADYKSGIIGHGLSGICKNKGSDIIIDAFLKLKNKNKLLLIGPMVEKIKLYENIENTGWVKRPENYLKKCSYFVNSARFEPFGLNILEAMCMGIPPIVSNKCGAYKIVEKVSKELIINPRKEDIIKKIEWLQNNTKIYKSLSKKSKLVAKKFIKENKIIDFKKKIKMLI